MLYFWGIGIDIAILFAQNKHTRYGIIVHLIIGLIIAFTTIASALPILIREGIPS
jgi:F0F1-type ATP synthase assembly protein I